MSVTEPKILFKITIPSSNPENDPIPVEIERLLLKEGISATRHKAQSISSETSSLQVIYEFLTTERGMMPLLPKLKSIIDTGQILMSPVRVITL